MSAGGGRCCDQHEDDEAQGHVQRLGTEHTCHQQQVRIREQNEEAEHGRDGRPQPLHRHEQQEQRGYGRRDAGKKQQIVVVPVERTPERQDGRIGGRVISLQRPSELPDIGVSKQPEGASQEEVPSVVSIGQHGRAARGPREHRVQQQQHEGRDPCQASPQPVSEFPNETRHLYHIHIAQ